MPSGHSACVTALATAIGGRSGWDSDEFAIAIVLAIVADLGSSQDGWKIPAPELQKTIWECLKKIGGYLFDQNIELEKMQPEVSIKCIISPIPMLPTRTTAPISESFREVL